MKRIFHRLVVLAVLTGGPAAGSIIQLTLSNANVSTSPGTTITFLASATNTTAQTQNFNSDSFAVQGLLTLDDTAFLNNWPLFLPPSGSFGVPTPQAIFSVTVPVGTAAALYTGLFEILGGPSPSDGSVIGSASFTVNVASAAPEPGTIALAGLALCGGVFLKRRRR